MAACLNGRSSGANTGHTFGILMACVGALHTFGAPAPLTLGYKGLPTFASSIQHGSIAAQLTHAFEFGFSIQISGLPGELLMLMSGCKRCGQRNYKRSCVLHLLQRTLMKDARQGLHSLVGLEAVSCPLSP